MDEAGKDWSLGESKLESFEGLLAFGVEVPGNILPGELDERNDLSGVFRNEPSIEVAETKK